MTRRLGLVIFIVMAAGPQVAQAFYYRLPLKIEKDSSNVKLLCTYVAVSRDGADDKTFTARIFNEMAYKLKAKDFEAINAGRSNLFKFEDLVCPLIHSPTNTRTVSDFPEEPQFQEYFIRSRLPDIPVVKERTANLPSEAVTTTIQVKDSSKVGCPGLEKLLHDGPRLDALCGKITDQALNRKDFFFAGDAFVGSTAKTCHYNWIEEAGNTGMPVGVTTRSCQAVKEWREKFFDSCHVPRKVPRSKSAPEWIYFANRFACACDLGPGETWTGTTLKKHTLSTSSVPLQREDCTAYMQPFLQENFMSLDRIKWIVENQLPERGKGGNL